jgi:hypothetical protein
MKNIVLSEGSEKLFKYFANDSWNWSGQPLVTITDNKDRGHLTDLKKKGLVKTDDSEGCMWLKFTPLGRAYASSKNIGVCND